MLPESVGAKVDGKLPDLAIQIIGFLAGMITATAVIMDYAYDKFQTKEQAVQADTKIEGRLQRIEDKIDRIFEAAIRKRD